MTDATSALRALAPLLAGLLLVLGAAACAGEGSAPRSDAIPGGRPAVVFVYTDG